MTVAEFYEKHGTKSFFEYLRGGVSDYRFKGHYFYGIKSAWDDGYEVSIGDAGYQNSWQENAKPDDVIEEIK